ncbi:hypothetical protein HYPBUDRAFT_5251 [Hyphopichia burtonii NRRL Y-1933]|uniref:Uncharacterized protein n=1 Tax=Hyphopichia burtonii NRRL Y-1933 TaxID=984485 RepID=A0A1E4RPK9_9ASCO|nr:hypothetical protein HYPBUDRAFT_5251 [Hyphopichia burtonii NRRL Y-1933]ODV69212.1 hypothetical protein HYPBUDRAFT_5251 [Hyphopichia burtonii NRRL Y-1933]
MDDIYQKYTILNTSNEYLLFFTNNFNDITCQKSDINYNNINPSKENSVNSMIFNRKIEKLLPTTHRSILKNKVNENLDWELSGSKNLDSVEFEDFYSNFKNNELLKLNQEPLLNNLRLIQLENYYNCVI